MYGVIYKVTNTVNGNIYIGQTKTALYKRWSKHCSDARSGAGWILAAAIRKHGREAFTVEVVEECPDKDALNAAEIAWILKLQPTYNSCGGGGGLGSPSPEVRAKISATSRGRKVSEQARKNMSAAQKGHPVSEETKRKIYEANAWYREQLRQKRLTQPKKRIVRPYVSPLQNLYEAHGATSRKEKMVRMAVSLSVVYARSKSVAASVRLLRIAPAILKKSSNGLRVLILVTAPFSVTVRFV